MPHLSSIEPEDKVPHVMAKFPNGSQLPLLDLHQALLRGASDFTVPERELMAAFVSATNSCAYCYGAHAAVAHQLGVEESLLSALVADIDEAPTDARLKPVFHFLRKLTLSPARISTADAAAILDEGWSEQAFYDMVSICCLYNFMNRFVEGLGLAAIPSQFDFEARMIVQGGYNSMAGAFGIGKERP